MNTDIEILIKDTYSMQQLRARIRLLKDHFATLHFGKETKETVDEKDTAWLTNLDADFLKQFNKMNVQEKMQQLEQAVNQIQPLTIYLAFEIPNEEIVKMGLWFRKEINKSIVFETKLDPSRIGGCAFSYKGIYKDFSLAARIQGNGKQILTSLKQTIK